MRQLLANTCLAIVALTSLSACGTIKKMANAVPVPDLSGVASMIPGMGGGPEDPEVPFFPQSKLGYGHSLKVAVYDGARVATRLYHGVVMINQEGLAEFPQVGSVKIGGRTTLEARAMIESLFRSAGQAASRTHVHLESVEETPLITVIGDVATPVIVALTRKMSVSEAIAQAGGRRPGSLARSVYVTHEGVQKFYVTAAKAEMAVKLSAGDIITLSPDL